MNWLLDPSVTTFGGEIDRMYYIILVITGIVFVLTEALLLYFLVRYRGREGQRAEYNHGNMRAEVVWTAVPFVIVIALALMSIGVWERVKDPDMFPDDAYEIILQARQFEWESVYPGADGELGTDDDFTLLNRIHVPLNRPVIIHLRAEDVIHSFFVPDFRVKQDAVPGMELAVWFEVTEPGEYTLACAELCGIGHYQMDGVVVVQPEGEFEAWTAERIALQRGRPADAPEVADRTTPAESTARDADPLTVAGGS